MSFNALPRWLQQVAATSTISIAGEASLNLLDGSVSDSISLHENSVEAPSAARVRQLTVSTSFEHPTFSIQPPEVLQTPTLQKQHSRATLSPRQLAMESMDASLSRTSSTMPGDTRSVELVWVKALEF